MTNLMLKNKTYQNWHQDIQKFKYYSTYSNDGESIPIKKTISPMASLMNSCKQPRKKKCNSLTPKIFQL